MLESSWKRCWTSIEAQGSGAQLMGRLIQAYGEPQRKYHTIQHLEECLNLFEQHISCAQESGEVEMALWFHDAVYSIRRSDNEEKSAAWAVDELKKAGVRSDRIDRVRDHILATRHSALPTGRDQELLVDIDLSILGADAQRFEEYERQVREEYCYVPGFLFRRNRKKLLAQFLARSPIYAVPELREQLEERARRNIMASIERLGG